LIFTGLFKFNSVSSFLLNVAKDSGVMGKSFTNFSEFLTFGAAWLNALGKNLVRAARDSKKLKEDEHSGWTEL